MWRHFCRKVLPSETWLNVNPTPWQDITSAAGAGRPTGGRTSSPRASTTRYDETTWSARTWLSFVSQRLSVATQLAAAQEVAEALGLSVAADPRLQ